MRCSLHVFLFSCCILLPVASAEAAPRTFTLTPLVTVERPVDIRHAGDDRLFVVSQAGRIFVWDGSRLETFLDIRDRVLFSTGGDGEQGLLSLAFHPDHADNRAFYVNYTEADGDSVIARFRTSTADPDRANAGSEVKLLEIPQPDVNHNVAQLQFGPDGYLYVSTGDGGYLPEPRCTPQERDNLLGKILRLDVDQSFGQPPYHGIPPTNPFVGSFSIRDEIWALGLRNPWRFSFDRGTGDLWIADAGQDTLEEVNRQPAGAEGGDNYGWKMMEGTSCRGSASGCSLSIPPCNAAAYTPPTFEYGHADTRCAVIGGYVYRGSALPQLTGHYVFGDFCGQLWAAAPVSGGWDLLAMEPNMFGVVSLGEDAAGELYVSIDGTVYAITDADLRAAEPGTLTLVPDALAVQEGAGTATLTVTRTEGSVGMVSVTWSALPSTASAGADFSTAGGVLVWADGDEADKTIAVPIVQDNLVEGDEQLVVSLRDPTGGATLGSTFAAVVTIEDDDVPTGPCVPSDTVLCLRDGRFRVEVDWRTVQGATGSGEQHVLSDDAGYFHFFNPDNPEIFVKVLRACQEPWNTYWVFAAGLTDVETHLTVVDTESGLVKRYDKSAGVGFEPIRDTRAFATCP